jgi:regulatory protein
MARYSDAKLGTSAYVAALKMLARRELSEAQVRQRLARRRHPSRDIDAAIDRLTKEAAIDDRRVARAIVRHETSVKRRGKLRIKQAMARAGIAAATAVDAIHSEFVDVDDDALLDASLSKRLRHGRTIADDREFQRLYRYLVGQGFESNQVLKVLSTRRGPKPEA